MNKEQKEFGLSLLLRGAGIYMIVEAITALMYALGRGLQYFQLLKYGGNGSRSEFFMYAPYVFMQWASSESNLLSYGLCFVVLFALGWRFYKKADVIAKKIIDKAILEAEAKSVEPADGDDVG